MDERVSLAPLDPQEVLRALFADSADGAPDEGTREQKERTTGIEPAPENLTQPPEPNGPEIM